MPSNKEMDALKHSIDDNLGDMYGSVYYSDPSISKTLSYMRTRAHRGIDNLISSNISNIGLTSISSLLTRTSLMDAQSDTDLIESLNHSLENETLINSIMQSYTQNSWIRDLDREVDMVLKYMPKLEDALNTRREHVLCSDNFTSTSLRMRSKSAAGDDVGVSKNIQTMKDKYQLEIILDKVYRNIDKYGEAFVYIVPYKKAIDRLMRDNMQMMGGVPTSSLQDSAPIVEAFTVTADLAKMDNDFKFSNIAFNSIDEAYFDQSNAKFGIKLDKGGVIRSFIESQKKALDTVQEGALLSLNESLRVEVEAAIQEKAKDNIVDKTSISDEINKHKESFYTLDGLVQDGLKQVGFNNGGTDKLKVPGAVVKVLDHSMVKPLYIDDICIGYFYIETDKRFDLEHTTFSSTIGGIRPGGMYRSRGKDPYFRDQQESQLLKNLAMSISRRIDKSFVNANQDLTKEIYAILKYNSTVNAEGKISRMRITFIPPDDMVHCFFEQDEESKRGISSLNQALFPAKLYACLYISNVVSILTRGNDKRVYYVKQMVDTNISQILMNTIDAIQRSNFGVRQIESMNNVLNILGRFNDLLIPKGPSGDAPIDMETIPGQNVDVKTDLLNMLEEMAVQSTGVPFDYIQAHQATDYATRLTMTNTRFLQVIYNLQSLTKKIFSRILTKIYNAEFEASEEIEYVPNVPTYLMCMNTSQILSSAQDISQAIADMYVVDTEPNADAIKPILINKLKKKYTSLFFPADDMEQLVSEAKMEAIQNKSEE